SKPGSGMLIVSNTSTGTTYVTQGILSLPNSTSGAAKLQGGTLQASGTLSSLGIQSNSTLDISGTASGKLLTKNFGDSGGYTLTINFGIGSTQSDLWTITEWHPSEFRAGSFQFEFRNLGGVRTG